MLARFQRHINVWNPGRARDGMIRNFVKIGSEQVERQSVQAKIAGGSFQFGIRPLHAAHTQQRAPGFG